MNELWLREETDKLQTNFEDVIYLIEEFIDKPTISNRKELQKEVTMTRKQLNKIMLYINNRWLKGE